MSRFAVVAAALLLCVACDHSSPVAPPPQPPPPPLQPPPQHVNHPPIARISGPSTVQEGLGAIFSASASTDSDGDPLRFYWIWVGFPQYGGSTDSLVEQGRSYPDDGLYTVKLIAIDSAGASDTASTTLTVTNAPPVLNSIEPPTQQAVGIPASARVAFSDAGSKDILTLTIRWGDGTSDSVVADTIPWMADSIVHTYTRAGSYLVGAIVRDDDDGVDSATARDPVIVFDATEREIVGGYEVSDIGTLGGNSAMPLDLNNSGQIVGSSLTASRERHAFLWENGTMRDLHIVGGAPKSQADRINDAGLIAGESFSWTGIGFDGGSGPVIWRNGVGGSLDGIRWSAQAVTVNASGDVLWRSYGHETVYGWLWHNGTMRQLHGPGEDRDELRPTDMNDRGQVVGLLTTQSRGASRIFHPFLWEADSVRDLGTLGPLECTNFGSGDCSAAAAMDINAAGQIVGTSTDPAGRNHFVIWEAGKIRDLGLAPSSYLFFDRAFINDRGQVAASAGGQAFFSSDGSWQSLGSLGGSVEVAGISEDGHVIGTVVSPDERRHAFVWSESSGMVDLGSGPHGFGRASVVGINASGDILGFAGPCDHRWDRKCGDSEDVRAILWRRK
jgi:probable HAF family extracellular repeat protein